MRWIALLACGALSGPLLAAECPIDRNLGQGLRLDSRLILGPGMLSRDRPSSDSLPQYFYGQSIDGSVDDEIHLVGSAEIRQLGSTVKAEEIRINLVENEIVAEGEVRLFREGEFFSGPRLRLRTTESRGVFETASYVFSSMNARGQAAKVEFQKPRLTDLTEVVFTTCPVDRPAWELRSSRMLVDQIREVAATDSTVLYWGGTPVLPLGDLSFPIGGKRRSGFLAPTYSANSELGFEITVPYYWNVAPNRDLTLRPRAITRRGVQLGVETRYLEKSYGGALDLEVLPNDVESGAAPDTRWMTRLAHTGQAFQGRLGVGLFTERVSDDAYLTDFGGSLIAASQRTLATSVRFTSSRDGWLGLLAFQDFQLLSDPAAPVLAPYSWAPRLAVGKARTSDPIGGESSSLAVDWSVDFELTSFRHRTLADGERVVASAKAGMPFLLGPVEVTPRLGLHSTHFQRVSEGSTTESIRLFGVNPVGSIYENNVGTLDHYQRVLPTYGLEAKLGFERASEWAGDDAIHTLEPRLFYVHTPYRDQSRAPVFDTLPHPPGMSQLFADTVYSGHDRVADQDQLTLALTTRFLSERSGEERFSATVAQRHYYADQKVTLPGEVVRTNRESDILAEVSLRYSKSLKGKLSTQYTPRQDRWQAGFAAIQYSPRAGYTVTSSYRYQRDVFDSVDLAFQAPMSSSWYAVGRLNYSLQDRQGTGVYQEPGLVEGLLGAEYDGGCWVGRVVVQQYVVSATKKTTALFFQVELNGLGRVGTDPLSALKRGVPNYQMINQLTPLPSRFENFQ